VEEEMQVMALYSMKGGVGKTSACVNLAHLAAMEGYVSLVWDLDPQGAATFYLGQKAKLKGGASAFLGKRSHLGNLTQRTDYPCLDLIPADLSHRNLDLLLDELHQSKQHLRKLLDELETEYEYVFLDCPPVLGLLAEHLFDLVDVLLFPMIPSALSERAYQRVRKYVKHADYPQDKLLPFFSMVDSRKRMHREGQINFSLRHPHTLGSVIPHASVVEQMGQHRAPLLTFADQSPAAEAFRRLWGEVKALHPVRGER
jgi:cellulose biosynthesis protein BcsQ